MRGSTRAAWIVAALLGTILASAATARAATYLIRPDGTGDFPTIQAGINSILVGDGDVLELADGTFTGPDNRDLDYRGKAITIRSQSGSAAACVIDAENAGRGVLFQSDEGPGSRLENVTITRGSAADGAGIHSGASCSPTLIGCRITGCAATGRGGGLYFLGGAATVTDCVIAGNSATAGGGVFTASAGPALNDCTIAENTASDGGGIFCQWSAGPISGCTFENNAASNRGGALIMVNGTLSLTDCVFTGNRGDIYGGAIQLLNGCAADIQRCEFLANTSAEGAGIALETDCSGEFRDCRFSGNSASQGACLAVRENSEVTLASCILGENEAINRAAAVYTNASRVTLNDCTIYRNQAMLYGGAVYAYESAITVGWCTFSENGSSYAGDFFCFENSTIEMQRSILAFSTAGPAIYCSFGGTASLTCCDVYGNAGGDWEGCLDGQNGLRGNFSADPLFCNPPAGDYTLAQDSPCAAENSPFGCGPVGAWPVGCEAPASVAARTERAAPSVSVGPNPAAGPVRLAFEIAPEAAGGALRLVVCDAAGRVVRSLIDERATPGAHALTWDGLDDAGGRVPSGIYAWRLEVAGTERSGRLTVIR